jgi:hypothetical protein
VRPSCRKKIRCPTPHKGADRNSCPLALPCVMPSANPYPMLWTAKSLNGLKVTGPLLLLPLRKANPFIAVVCCVTWQAWQPTFLKTTLPRLDEAVAAGVGGYTAAGADVGGALRRIKVAKLTIDNVGREIRRGAPRGRRIRVRRAEYGHVFRQRVELAARGRFIVTLVGKQLVGHAHLDEVSFAREHQRRLVLRLPAKSGDGAVVGARVELPRDP